MDSLPVATEESIRQARSRFFAGNSLSGETVSRTVLSSWQRSLNHGVAVSQDPADLPVLSAGQLAEAQEEGSDLSHFSRPIMEHLFGQIRQTSSMVILTDAAGTILHSIGDPDFVGKARKVSLQPGGVWTEPARGTNAIGTCLVEQAPVVIHRGEHFTTTNHFLTCSATPLFDPHGRVRGVLDVSGDGYAFQQHTMALVRISAQQIENIMFSRGFEDDLVLHFHHHPHFIGTFYEGIIVCSRSGQLLAANRSALLLLGLDRYHMDGTMFSGLFDYSFDEICARAAVAVPPLLEVNGRGDRKFYVRARSLQKGQGGKRVRLRTEKKPERPAPASRKLQALSLGDPVMSRMIQQAEKVLEHDIPILLEGESGTGKDLLARALHEQGSRRNGPFVALNCAAIPAGLIESELFGYRDGAFTGASRKGYRGKIRQADGGTLFLDEIGDMPLELQAMLLRVLQERRVAPLGATMEQAVDIAIICATNRNVSADISTGRFREDLYYRLNGLKLRLPPLRQRTDCLALASAMLRELAPDRSLSLSPEVSRLFRQHPWPGNIRQLHSVLRIASVLLDEQETELRLVHLPEDFFDQPAWSEDEWRRDRESRFVSAGDRALDFKSLQQLAISRAVDSSRGNLSAAARMLGISRTTLYRKLKAFKN